MKILLVSDKEDAYIWDHFDPVRFADIDFIISCGDMRAEYLSFLVTMINKPLYYVHGNHDKSYEQKPPEGCECIDGKLIVTNGLRILGLGGSMRYNPGPFQYTENEMNNRIHRLLPTIWRHRGIDIFVTHAPAKGINDGEDLCHHGYACFLRVLEKQKPRYFFHGHNHLDYQRIPRLSKAGATTVVNACGYYILDTEKTLLL